MYNIVFTNKAIKDVENLPNNIQHRIVEKLKEYSMNPFDYSRKLSDTKIGSYRFRVGDYRIVFDVDKETIVILRVGHRKEIYK